MLNLYITSPTKKEGKTFITAGLAATMQSLNYRTAVYKPIQTGGIDIHGFMQSPDLTYIKTIDPYIETHFTYLFREQAEPLVAAEKENDTIDLDFICKDAKRATSSADCILIDGDGGILSPIAPDAQNIDLINRFQMPILFVVTPSADSVNNTLISISAALENKAKVNGVVINNIKGESGNKQVTSLIRLIEEYSSIKVLGMVPNMGNNVAPQELITGILNGIDIESVFNVKIAKLDFN